MLPRTGEVSRPHAPCPRIDGHSCATRRSRTALLLELERLKAAFNRDAVDPGFVFGEELAFARASRTHDLPGV